MNQTFETLRLIAVRMLGVDADTLTPETRLDGLGIDSLTLTELLFEVEDAFGIALSEEAAPMVTLGELVNAIEARVPVA